MDQMGEVQLGLLPINMKDLTGAQNPEKSGKRVAEYRLQESRFQFFRFHDLMRDGSKRQRNSGKLTGI